MEYEKKYGRHPSADGENVNKLNSHGGETQGRPTLNVMNVHSKNCYYDIIMTIVTADANDRITFCSVVCTWYMYVSITTYTDS